MTTTSETMTTAKILKSFDQEFFDREGRRFCVLRDEQPLSVFFKEFPLAGIHIFKEMRSTDLELVAFACRVFPTITIGGFMLVDIKISFYVDHIVIYVGGKIRKVAVDESITQLPPYIRFDCPLGTGPELYFTNLYSDNQQTASSSPS